MQHAHNPVDWYPWGDEAFEKAEKEQKPILVSIGYAACHWCHVMEHESFEDEATAAYMNEHFINIKVDREERPDVDHLYMDAVQAISGSGGWPLNVFVTPAKAPFYGGTYFPPRPAYSRPSWLQLLQRINQLWDEQRDEVNGQGAQLLKHLQQASLQTTMQTNSTLLDKEACKKMCGSLLQMADKELGGFGNAPKFPGTMAINFLLEHYHFTKNEQALEHALYSLDAMLEGGIYDQLAGGFCRYSTDAQWLAPHFEKMLYDNALLIISLCHAYDITKDEKYKRVAEETIAFVNAELQDSSGLYYSALDADSEGVEGKFYTWTWEEWQQYSGDDNGIAALYFGVSEEGNWEGTNILNVAAPLQAIAMQTGLGEETVSQHIAKVKKNLLHARAKRIRPLTDDKSLLSWNALMNIALIKAGTSFGNDTYLIAATRHIHTMLEAFNNEELCHVWKKGEAKIIANIDDYAYLIQALIELSVATGEERWLLKANELAKTVLADFIHEDGDYFYFSSAMQKDIPVRKVDKYDGAQPSANAVMAGNLFVLGVCMDNTAFIEQSQAMWQQMAQVAMQHTYSFAQWALWQQRYVYGIKTVVIASEDGDALLKKWHENYLPNVYCLTSKKEISEIPLLKHKFLQSQTHIFVCTESACMPPVADLESALKFI